MRIMVAGVPSKDDRTRLCVPRRAAPALPVRAAFFSRLSLQQGSEMGFSGLNRLMGDRVGAIVVSVILGLGLAALFRRACKGDGCVVVRAPKGDDVGRYFYKLEDDCYKYTPYAAPC
jgi:hypothetical protein